jgi:hypothetical protein
MASISSTLVNSFMPMGVVRSRSKRFSAATSSLRSKLVWSELIRLLKGTSKEDVV